MNLHRSRMLLQIFSKCLEILHFYLLMHYTLIIQAVILPSQPRPNQTRPTSTSPTSRTTWCHDHPFSWPLRKGREVGERIHYTCPDRTCTHTPPSTGRAAAPMTIRPWGRMLPRTAPRWRTRPHQDTATSCRVAPHCSDPVQPNGRAYDRTHPARRRDHDEESAMHSDWILFPRSDPRRSGQRDLNPESRQPAMGQATLPVQWHHDFPLSKQSVRTKATTTASKPC
jgi:hypothetical protein